MNTGIFAQYWRVGGVCGLLFVVMCIVGGAIQGGPPTYSDDVDEIRAFWVDDGGTYLLGDYIIGLGFILFFFPFTSALRSLLGTAEGGTQMWSRIFYGGSVLLMALAAAAGAFWTTLAFGSNAETASDEAITLLMALDVGSYHFLPAAIAIMFLPAGLVIVITRALPVWHGALTLVIGIIATLSPLSILAENPEDGFGWLPFPLSGIWVLITSIVLLMKKEAPVPPVVREM